MRAFSVSCWLFFTAQLLAGAELSGIWTGEMKDRNGDPQDLSFQFHQLGTKLTGKMYGDNESTPITDGSIVGNQFTFMVTSELNGQISKFIYSGTVSDNTLKVTRERESVGKPSTAAKVPPKPDAKIVFTLKKLT
jgi:hypothetical protein